MNIFIPSRVIPIHVHIYLWTDLWFVIMTLHSWYIFPIVGPEQLQSGRAIIKESDIRQRVFEKTANSSEPNFIERAGLWNPGIPKPSEMESNILLNRCRSMSLLWNKSRVNVRWIVAFWVQQMDILATATQTGFLLWCLVSYWAEDMEGDFHENNQSIQQTNVYAMAWNNLRSSGGPLSPDRCIA